MSLIANAKAKALKGNVSEAFKNEEGAIDLASIMVGIIVIGLIGGVIAATVFAVIPWAQDNAAKQQLDSVAAAQSAFIGLTSDTGKTYYAGTTVAGTFGVLAGNKVALGTQVLFDGGTATNLVIAAVGTGDTAHYGAAAKSSSGKTFYITDTKTQPTAFAAVPADAAAQTAAKINANTSGVFVAPALASDTAPKLTAS